MRTQMSSVGQACRIIMHKDKPISAFDVAAYILKKQTKQRTLTAMKLQKLLYYCQAWSLVWDEVPLFNEKVFAWANGPIVKELYEDHKGQFYIKKLTKGDPSLLSENQKDTVDQVLMAYGDKTAQWLSDLTHLEDPWNQARAGLHPGDRGNVEITLALMHEYYSSINKDNLL